MVVAAGIHRIGPDNGTLSVRTGKTGAAAKAGHNLVIHVTGWEGTLEVAPDGGDASVTLDADGSSLRVHESSGGVQALGDDEKASIQQSIDDDVLKRRDISFRSTRVRIDGDAMAVQGDLTLADQTHPITFDLTLDGDHLSGSAVVTQSAWGIKPFSTLFGALKVADDVEVSIDATLPPQSR